MKLENATREKLEAAKARLLSGAELLQDVLDAADGTGPRELCAEEALDDVSAASDDAASAAKALDEVWERLSHHSEGTSHIEILDKRIRAPRADSGVDYGAEGIVLARRGKTELIWRYSCKVWGGLLGGYQHEPARLEIHDRSGRLGCRTRDLHCGGRLSKRLLKELAPKIDETFGMEISSVLHPQKTVIITDPADSQKPDVSNV